MKDICGSLINETYCDTVPIPAADELVHAIDNADTALFIWRDRPTDNGTDKPALDWRHVNIARMDYDADKKARLLCISVGAVAHPAWVTSIVTMTGFNSAKARFGVTPADKVPVDHWQTLNDAVTKRMEALRNANEAMPANDSQSRD